MLEREIWRIAVENLDYPEQHAGRRWPAPASTPRAGAALGRCCSTTAPKSAPPLPADLRAAQPQLAAAAQSAGRDRRPVRRRGLRRRDRIVGTWSRDDNRAGTKTLLQALVDKRIGRRDQAQAWVWRLASYTRELHEEYAVQRWPETKRLLGLLVNSSGRAHGRNARRLVHAARKQDRRLAVALLAAAVSHTPEGEEVLRGARMRGAETVGDRARVLRNFPKGGKRRRRRNRQAQGRPKARERTGPRRTAHGRTGAGGRGVGGRRGESTGAEDSNGAGGSQSRRWTSPAPRATIFRLRRLGDDEIAMLVDPVGRHLAHPPSRSRAPSGGRARANRQGPRRRRAPSIERTARSGPASRSSAGPNSGDLVDGRKERAAVSRRPGGNSTGRCRVEADADHGPAVLWPGLDQDAGNLAAPRSRRRWAI